LEGNNEEGGSEGKDVPVPVAATMISWFVSLLRRPMVAVGTWLSPQMTWGGRERGREGGREE